MKLGNSQIHSSRTNSSIWTENMFIFVISTQYMTDSLSWHLNYKFRLLQRTN